jgi:hypothetical protein
MNDRHQTPEPSMMKTAFLILALFLPLIFAGVAQAQTSASSTQNTAPTTSAGQFVPPDPRKLQQYNRGKCESHFHQMRIPKADYSSFITQCMRVRQGAMELPVTPDTTTTTKPTAK